MRRGGKIYIFLSSTLTPPYLWVFVIICLMSCLGPLCSPFAVLSCSFLSNSAFYRLSASENADKIVNVTTFCRLSVTEKADKKFKNTAVWKRVFQLTLQMNQVLYFNMVLVRLWFPTNRYIKLSSPKLNNVAVVGCILVYMAVIMLGVDDRSLADEAFPIVCSVGDLAKCKAVVTLCQCY